MLGLGIGASPNGHAHIVVRVGRSIVHVYDRGALEAYVGAWTAALDHRHVFGGGGEAFAEVTREVARLRYPMLKIRT